jgi:hypothetical protein
MFTWGPKFLFAVSLAGLIGAFAYGVVTGGDPIGVATLGYKGGVGDHFGYAVLIGVGISAHVVGWLLVATRDGDAEAMAQRAGVTSVPAVTQPADPSFWAPMSAFGVAAIIAGLAVSMIFFYLGLVVLFVAGLQWLVQAWSDRATGDPAINRVIRDRVVGPFEVPVMALLGFALVAIAMSRVFLAASATGAVIAGTVATVIIFGSAVLFSKVDVKPAVLRGVVALGAVAVLAAGIAGATVGERDFHHGEEHSEDPGEDHSGDGEGE